MRGQEFAGASPSDSFRNFVLRIAYETGIGTGQANTSGASSDARGAVRATPGISHALKLASQSSRLQTWTVLVTSSPTRGTFTSAGANPPVFCKRFYRAGQVP
jgi:hypothetical protein